MAYATSTGKKRTLIEAKGFFKLHFVNHCTSHKRQYTSTWSGNRIFECKWVTHRVNCTYNILQVRTCIVFCVNLCLNNKQKKGKDFKFPSPPLPKSELFWPLDLMNYFQTILLIAKCVWIHLVSWQQCLCTGRRSLFAWRWSAAFCQRAGLSCHQWTSACWRSLLLQMSGCWLYHWLLMLP